MNYPSTKRREGKYNGLPTHTVQGEKKEMFFTQPLSLWYNTETWYIYKLIVDREIKNNQFYQLFAILSLQWKTEIIKHILKCVIANFQKSL